MKLIAFYLPQYHRIPENDEWWGEGFTEWTNVKRAKAVFKNQSQPKVPYNNNYYDLMDKSTVEWQTNLMKEYGIYGFCYFHYWFTGKQLLQKPAENLLRWKEIEQPFCFAWANVTWARTWSAAKKNLTNWVSEDSDGGTGILVEQKYGNESDWREHYRYLREFFTDQRYIKIDNKPMFLVYKLHDIPDAEKMFQLWNEMALKDGFSGLHLVSINEAPEENKYVEAVAKYGNYGAYDRHCIRSIYNRVVRKFHLPFPMKSQIFDYETVWRNMVKEKPDHSVRTYPGAVVMYDETPRKGKKAVFLAGASPEIFEKYLKEQIDKAKNICKTDFIFVDAWNEWGEGNYLEPDTENEFAYLEAVRKALNGERA